MSQTIENENFSLNSAYFTIKKKQEQLLQCLKKMSIRKNTDDQRQQLLKFQHEVELKYKLAKHNHEYKFPFEYQDKSGDSSLEELKRIGHYDLHQQNIVKTASTSLHPKPLTKIMSSEVVRPLRQTTRYKTEQTDENKSTFINKSIDKSSNEQLMSFLRKSVAKRSQFSQHNNNTQRQHNNNHLLSQSFNASRTQNYYLNKFTKMKLDMLKQQNQTSNSNLNHDSKISLKHFFSKSPDEQQSCTINLKNKLAEMCKRQPLRVIK